MSEIEQPVKSALLQTVSTTATDYWNDSCSVEELTYAIENGAVGATTNPTIVMNVLKKEMHLWSDRIHHIIKEYPTWSEKEVMWQVFEEVAVHGAGLLKPVYDRHNGLKGRLSIQTNPAFYRNPAAILEQAEYFNQLAPNMQIKMPATQAGIVAIEEATYRGININATVSFTVAQAIAVGEAVERGLNRRAAESKDLSSMRPVCTIMIGRTDDWMRISARLADVAVTPEAFEWAGIATFKKAYGIFQKRGYRARLLAAAYRNLNHWAALIGGDIVLTIPYEWQLKINASNIEVKERIHIPVEPAFIEELLSKLPEFGKAYEEDGLTIQEFDSYGATVRTLRTFIASVHDLMGLIREFMLPDPDIKV
ncbi:MAG: transaldolase family protein [Anaerolineaceae bacterium]|nr:transaldolase family protein [Anaerolineaceae bacterium]